VRFVGLWILLVAVYAATLGIPAQPGMDYAGSEPMRIADCRRLHGRWFAAHKPADAA